jgi:hypothetical protein
MYIRGAEKWYRKSGMAIFSENILQILMNSLILKIHNFSSAIQVNSRTMYNFEHRALIKFFTKQGKSADTILIEMQGINGVNALSKTIIDKCLNYRLEILSIFSDMN